MVAIGCGSGGAPRPAPVGGDARPDAATPTPTPTLVDAAVPEVALVDAAVPDAVVAAAPAAPPPGWTDLAVAIPDAVLDLRYATPHNFTGATLYPAARCWLRDAVATRLALAADALRADGYRLLLWDCYRPASVQVELWARVPDPRFVARPRFDEHGQPIGGSVHSRGGAVDLGLADRDGKPLEMPTDHDDFSAAAAGAGARGEIKTRLLALRAAMKAAGFTPIRSEWWHFEARGLARGPLADFPLQ